MIILPWPPKELSPNARVHWSKKSKAASQYKLDAFNLTKAAKVAKPGPGSVLVALTFHPPCKRRRDLDNMLASIKNGLDGIALAIGVDDQRFRLSLERSEPQNPGRVEVVLS